MSNDKREGPLCNFCGRKRMGGVAGPSPDIYICADCIRLAHQMLEGPALYQPENEQKPDPA